MGDNKSALNERFRILSEMQQREAGIYIYNGSDQIIDQQYYGRRFRLFPDAEVVDPKTGVSTTYDGMNKITDMFGPDEAQLSAWRTKKDKGEANNEDLKRVPRKQLATAGEIVAHIVSKNRDLGLTELSLDSDKAEEQKKEARRVAVASKLAHSEEVLKHYRARTSGKTPGSVESLMNTEELRASTFVTEYAAGKYSKKRHVCRFLCGFWNYDEKVLTQHYNVNHEEVIAEEGRTKRPVGRPRKAQVVA